MSKNKRKKCQHTPGVLKTLFASEKKIKVYNVKVKKLINLMFYGNLIIFCSLKASKD